jgi:RimJ/RimL family protein N-acetyltransferase
MEIMPFVERIEKSSRTMANRPAQDAAVVTSTDWREQLPVLTARGITLRELRLEDAPSLFAMLTTEEVSRFISPPPTTVEGREVHRVDPSAARGGTIRLLRDRS